MSDLPPLAALRVFEAAARHCNFTRAAEELGMTQAAVSYQIKLLEERSGGPLFLRKARQVELTELGRRLAGPVTEAFDLIRGAFSSVRQEAQGVLVINCGATFAARWLAQRIGTFQLQHPELAVRFDVSHRQVDFARETVDVTIRAGLGNWPGLAAHMIKPAPFTPMLSPRLAASIGGVREPADLLKLKIIDPSDPWWRVWFTSAGLENVALDARSRSQMGAQVLEAQAAVAGQGVAILTPDFYREELERGLLVQPFDLVASNGESYWLVYPEGRRNNRKIRAFRDWIIKVAGEA